MSNTHPKVSIIMGIYNCSSTLKESIESLIVQTYTNWELIMCDDGSTDKTYSIAKSYENKFNNIKVLKNNKNYGLAFTLNRCIKVAKGKYIARQDGDDRSTPTRLEKEVKLLDSWSKYDIVSTSMAFFDENGYWGKVISKEMPQPNDLIQQTPFCHAPCMIRKKALLDVKGYQDSRKLLRVEDYDLMFRLYANGSRGFNIQEVLYEVRDDRQAIKRRKFTLRINEAYTRFSGYKRLKLPLRSYIYVLRPIIIGLLPRYFYKQIRRKIYRNVKIRA
ncbi:glycosyltransferase family 2 protein [Salipaludibacillus sp. HK11]|uniref:glycosyltransferase family 2 protein n=1 Tax=Salipaludibacillus sp. HK11 TaxID=3394320 RepID=UPI0039FDB900